VRFYLLAVAPAGKLILFFCNSSKFKALKEFFQLPSMGSAAFENPLSANSEQFNQILHRFQ
jgi:hypothetical protein